MNLTMSVLACVSLAGAASAEFIRLDRFTGSESVQTFAGFDMTGLGSLVDLGGGLRIENRGSGSGRAGWKANTDWGAYFSNIAGASKRWALADAWGASDLLLSFDEGVDRVGFLLSTGGQTRWDIEVYDPEGELLDVGSAIMPWSQQAVFFGYEALGAGIGAVRISDSENGSITIVDDIRYERIAVPGPGALAALGLATLGASRRRGR
jgi:hypothetical protein